MAAIRILLCLLLLPSAAVAFDPFSDPARYEIRYAVDPAGLPDGTLRLWVPLPVDRPGQVVESLALEAPEGATPGEDRLGNRMLHVERAAGAEREPIVVRATVLRTPVGTFSSEAASGALDPGHFRAAQKRIPLDGVIAQLAVQEAAGLSTDTAKVRAYYDYVVANLKYAKHGKGWGEGDAIWACTEKYGNCTDFHSLFIGMARSQRIPARFVIGFPIPRDRAEGEVGGYHCWANAWLPDAGWLPFDASEAHKAGTPDVYFGRLPSDRVEFTAGRDLVLTPPQAGDPLNYFVYPYAEVDGVPTERPTWSFSFRRLSDERVELGQR